MVGVHDADTLTVVNGVGKRMKVRLGAVDAPELGQVGGYEARDFVRGMVPVGSQVGVVPSGARTYDRVVADVYLPDGRRVEEELARAGRAYYQPQYGEDPVVARAQMAAQAEGAGEWRVRPGGFPEDPKDWRAGAEAETKLRLPWYLPSGFKRSAQVLWRASGEAHKQADIEADEQVEGGRVGAAADADVRWHRWHRAVANVGAMLSGPEREREQTPKRVRSWWYQAPTVGIRGEVLASGGEGKDAWVTIRPAGSVYGSPKGGGGLRGRVSEPGVGQGWLRGDEVELGGVVDRDFRKGGQAVGDWQGETGAEVLVRRFFGRRSLWAARKMGFFAPAAVRLKGEVVGGAGVEVLVRPVGRVEEPWKPPRGPLDLPGGGDP